MTLKRRNLRTNCTARINIDADYCFRIEDNSLTGPIIGIKGYGNVFWLEKGETIYLQSGIKPLVDDIILARTINNLGEERVSLRHYEPHSCVTLLKSSNPDYPDLEVYGCHKEFKILGVCVAVRDVNGVITTREEARSFDVANRAIIEGSY